MRFNHPRLVWRMYCEVLASWKAKTRLRPCSLAVKQAVSASESTAERLGASLRDRDHADAHADLERLLAPFELPRLHRVAQLRGRGLGELGAAVLEQHRELVAADAREHLAVAQGRLQHRRQAAQQLVAREVPEGIVDAVEEVDVEVEQRVGAALALGVRDRALQALLERLAVGQPRERIVVGEEEDLLARRVQALLHLAVLRLQLLREVQHVVLEILERRA